MLGRHLRQAVVLIVGRLAFDYLSLLSALRATGARPHPSLVLLAYAATGIIALLPLTPGGLGIVEGSLSGLLVLAGVSGSDAVVATLAYRLASYWLPTFAGVVASLLFHHRFGPVNIRAHRPDEKSNAADSWTGAEEDKPPDIARRRVGRSRGQFLTGLSHAMRPLGRPRTRDQSPTTVDEVSGARCMAGEGPGWPCATRTRRVRGKDRNRTGGSRR